MNKKLPNVEKSVENSMMMMKEISEMTKVCHDNSVRLKDSSGRENNKNSKKPSSLNCNCILHLRCDCKKDKCDG